jgi:hypothetical protein
MTENDFKKIAGNSSNFLDYTKKVTDILKNNNNSLTGEEAGLMNKVWDDYDKNKNKNKSSSSSTLGTVVKDTVGSKGIQSFSYNVASSQLASGQSDVLGNAIDGLVNFLQTTGTTKEKISKGFGSLATAAEEAAVQHLKDEVILRNDINSQIGISGQLSQDFREEIIESLPVIESMGYSFDDLSKTVIKTMEQTGRFSLVNRETMEKMAITSRAFIGDMESSAKLVRDFELLGIGNEEAFDNINKIGQSSLNIGLQARKVVSETQTNLSKINEYGFRNGVEGLSRMVQKSIEFRMGMAETFKIADKVFSPEGAIELSANLQAIGGAIGDLNDPLKLMYMATNNVEGLQDALIGVAGSLATYNTEQGRFEITGINLRRAKGLADELGISYNELANGAIAAAERSSAAIDLLSSGLKLEDKEKEFLTNISRMEGGKMVIDIPESLAQKLGIKETRVALENLDQNTAAALLENQKYFETLSPEEIAREQYSATQLIKLSVNEIATMLKVRFASVGRVPLQNVDEYLRELNNWMNKPDDKSTANSSKSFTDPLVSGLKDLFNIQSLSSTQNRQPYSGDNKNLNLTIKSDVRTDRMAEHIMSEPFTIQNITNGMGNFLKYGGSSQYGNNL